VSFGAEVEELRMEHSQTPAIAVLDSASAESMFSARPPRQVESEDSGTIWIRAERRGAFLDVRNIWTYRELLYFLAWRDVKVRYKQTLLGGAWAVIQPVVTMVVFTILFGKLAKMPSDGAPYPIFAYAALLPWTYFSGAITSSGNSLVADASLITKVYFPRMIIPAAAVLAGLVDFAISTVVLIFMMWYYGVALTWHLALFAPLVLLTVLLAMGVGMYIAALNVRYRDVRYAVPFIIQIWLFATPVIYPASIVPDRWRWIFNLNPLSGIIQSYRAAILDTPFDWGAAGVSVAITAVVTACSLYWFRRMERTFADLV
jgi:lipopolysaccharide transport system permease protein